MNPPPAEGLASRLFLGPALRTQPDGRLVSLVRDGYDAAFEEIVRRYGRPLTRYAAGIVGGRSEDVTQDAFSKALLALRRDSDAKIDLKPWLYRIVRNTALNDLRDRPPDTAELVEALERGSGSAAEEAERREEMSELLRRLRALPEPQRAAIVMRELEGLSHDEIAAALGLSGGAARQAIYRARQSLRDGFGLLVPMPLLRMLIEHGSDAGAGAAAVGAGGAAAVGGAGAGTALKVGVVTAVLAGSVGTGLAIKDDRTHEHRAETAAAATVPAVDAGGSGAPSAAPAPGRRAGPGDTSGAGDSSAAASAPSIGESRTEVSGASDAGLEASGPSGTRHGGGGGSKGGQGQGGGPHGQPSHGPGPGPGGGGGGVGSHSGHGGGPGEGSAPPAGGPAPGGGPGPSGGGHGGDGELGARRRGGIRRRDRPASPPPPPPPPDSGGHGSDSNSAGGESSSVSGDGSPD